MTKDNKSNMRKKKTDSLAKDRIPAYGGDHLSSKKKFTPEERLKKIGAKLRRIRLERGYTSYESFAWDHELPRMQYWRMENGKNFTFISLIKILDALEMPLSEFFDEEF